MLWTKGGKEVYKHRQVLAEYNAASARSSNCRRVLHGRRHAVTAAASSARATRDLPEVSDWIPGKEAPAVSAIFLRL